jgi:hypothetical protein
MSLDTQQSKPHSLDAWHAEGLRVRWNNSRTVEWGRMMTVDQLAALDAQICGHAERLARWSAAAGAEPQAGVGAFDVAAPRGLPTDHCWICLKKASTLSLKGIMWTKPSLAPLRLKDHQWVCASKHCNTKHRKQITARKQSSRASW